MGREKEWGTYKDGASFFFLIQKYIRIFLKKKGS